MSTPDWAGQKRAQRGHARGDHSMCNYRRCRSRQLIEQGNEDRLRTIALFEELHERGINPERFFGADLGSMRELVDSEPVEWLDGEPDFLHRIQAKVEVDNYAYA